MAAVDTANTSELREFVTAYGWPSITEFGVQASQNAWLLAQHADAAPEFQTFALERMKDLGPDEVTPQNLAYLEDRIATRSGKQVYGTQGQCVGPGQWEPNPIRDPEKVDERRASVGLNPLAEYKKDFVNICP